MIFIIIEVSATNLKVACHRFLYVPYIFQHVKECYEWKHMFLFPWKPSYRKMIILTVVHSRVFKKEVWFGTDWSCSVVLVDAERPHHVTGGQFDQSWPKKKKNITKEINEGWWRKCMGGSFPLIPAASLYESKAQVIHQHYWNPALKAADINCGWENSWEQYM